MTAPGFNLVDVEPGLYVHGEFGELHSSRSAGGRSTPISRWENEVAKRIRGHGQAVARGGGKGVLWLRWIGGGLPKKKDSTRRYPFPQPPRPPRPGGWNSTRPEFPPS